jgi:cytochrome c-type biogenesis protein CcmH|tara:strand:+ start:1038 stop:1406 length:369 start_codon:yes stop_codon:yes gene_type:complete
MILKNFYKLFLLFLLLFPFNVTSQEQIRIDFYKTIRCLVCDGQSIYDSETAFAQNLREQIKLKFNQGLTKEEIKNELLTIYGEDISFQPRKNKLFLWFSPFIILSLIFGLNISRYKKKLNKK